MNVCTYFKIKLIERKRNEEMSKKSSQAQKNTLVKYNFLKFYYKTHLLKILHEKELKL